MRYTFGNLNRLILISLSIVICVGLSFYLMSSMRRSVKESKIVYKCKNGESLRDISKQPLKFPLIIQNDQSRSIIVCRSGTLRIAASHVASESAMILVRTNGIKEFFQGNRPQVSSVTRGDRVIFLGNDGRKGLEYREVRVGNFRNSAALCNPVKPEVAPETGGVYNPYTGVATAIFTHPIIVPSCRGGDITFQVSGIPAGGAFPHVDIRQGKMRQQITTSNVPRSIRQPGSGGDIQIYLLNPYRSQPNEHPLSINTIYILERPHD